MKDITSLFPDDNDTKAYDGFLSSLLDEIYSDTSKLINNPEANIDNFRTALANKDFAEPEHFEALLEWTVSALKNGMLHTIHPGYLGLFNPAPAFQAQCADRIAAALNPVICVWSHAPAAVEIEEHVIKSVAFRAGFSENAGGHFTSGGSEANMTGLICALTAASPASASQGSRAFSGRPTIYISSESHLAWLKIAHSTGIGRNAVRLVETDGTGRMNTVALEAQIEKDRNDGEIPVMIASTAGTTNAGMIDPLHHCADIAERFGIWHHIDAAWAGALIASENHRSVLSGFERADSITIDAHKWFATTVGAGMFLTQRNGILAKAFHVSTNYMPTSNEERDLYANSIQWSRRFVGLRLFLSLACVGWRGYALHVEHSLEIIEYLIRRLKQAGWHHENNSPAAVACFSPPPGSRPVQDYVDKANSSGRYWVSVTKFENKPVLRACVTNGKTTNSQIDGLVEELSLFEKIDAEPALTKAARSRIGVKTGGAPY